jgi:hypothetical protein
VQDVDHRQLGIDLFNYTWTLLEKKNRTLDEARASASYA